MMLLVLIIALLVVSIVIWNLGNKCWDKNYEPKTMKQKIENWFYYNDETLTTIGVSGTVICGIALFVMILILIDVNTFVDAKAAKMNETYKSLCFKANNDGARDEFGLLNKEIVDEIQEWNETIVYNKEMQNNPWVGIFYPDFYEEFKTINLDTLNTIK